jgi:hypothetical protein
MAGQKAGKLLGLAVVNTLAAFLASKPGAEGETAARKALSLIADMDADEAVRKSARKAMDL